MYPSMFRDRINDLSNEVLSKNPPSMTGYLDSAASIVSQTLSQTYDVSLNGQRTKDSWMAFSSSANMVGPTLRIKDPNGSKEAVGFFTYRICGVYISGDHGKLMPQSGEPGKDLILADTIFQGSRFQSPTVVSLTRRAAVVDSTIMGGREAQSAGFIGPVQPTAPVDPFGGTVEVTGGNPADQFLKPEFRKPSKFSNLNPTDGSEFLVPDPPESTTPWGTNARTGTTAIGGADLLHPSTPSLGSSIKGGFNFSSLGLGDLLKNGF